MKVYGHSKFLCIASLFCSQTMSIATPTYPPTQLDSHREEYAVYCRSIKTVYIDNVAEDERFDLLVLQERTSLQDRVAHNLDGAFERWKNETQFLDEETLDDLKTRNKQSQVLDPVFDIPMRYAIVGKQDLTKSFGEGDPSDAWARFYKAYPNSSGLVGFSRVGFNRKMSQALVYLERSCGPSCADGRVIFLTKERDGWVVRKIYIMWVT